MNLQQYNSSNFKKVFLGGKPKSAGKTTLAMSAPGGKLVLQYDLGNPVIPPGVDPAQCWWQSYEPAIVQIPEEGGKVQLTDRWKRPTNVGERVLRDAEAIRNAFIKGHGIKLKGWTEEMPLPDVLILDGMTEMPLIMTDWVLGVNNKQDADDFIGEGGKVNHFKLWQLRLKVVRDLLHWVIPLPCTVVLIGWETEEMVENKKTGKIIPDIGGKLDNMIPGKVDAALSCYATFKGDGPHYVVRTQPDGVRDWVGLRGAFNMPKEIDVTIKGKGDKSPWNRVFNDNQ